EYSPYGTTTYRAGSTDTPFCFNGQFGVQTDPNGLLYMRSRYYNPYISRFLSLDPASFTGGLNLYVFGDGNPISEIDRFGLFSWQKIGQGTVEVGGALIAAVGVGLAEAPSGGAVSIALPTIFLGLTHGMTSIGVGLQSNPTTETQETFLNTYPSNPGQFIGLAGYGVSTSVGRKPQVALGLAFDIGSLGASEFELLNAFTQGEKVGLPLAATGSDASSAFFSVLDTLQTSLGGSGASTGINAFNSLLQLGNPSLPPFNTSPFNSTLSLNSGVK